MSGGNGGDDFDTTLATLCSMGFDSEHVLLAMTTTGKQKTEQLLEWLSENPAPSSSSSAAAKQKKNAQDMEKRHLQKLQDMGFTENHCYQAFEVPSNTTLEKLVNWLSTNAEKPRNAVPKRENKDSKSPSSKGSAGSSSPSSNNSNSNSSSNGNNNSSASKAGATNNAGSTASPTSGGSSSSSSSASATDGKDAKDQKRRTMSRVDDFPDFSHLIEPGLTRQDSTAVLRLMLAEQRKAGIRLTVEQNNFLLVADFTPGTKFKCAVCFDDDFDLDKIFVLEKCKHYLCQTCMSTHFVTLIKSNEASNLRCPMVDCKETIEHAQLEICIPSEEFQRYLSFMLDASLKADPTCRWCPKPGCGTAMIGNPKIPLMRCPREGCNFAFCFNCKEEWHSDTTCEEFQKWKEENAHAEDRFAQWVKKNTKPCPKCKVPIQKNAGCNHMKCTSCKHEFCWLCLKSVLGPNGKYKEGHWALDPSSPCYEKMHT